MKKIIFALLLLVNTNSLIAQSNSEYSHQDSVKVRKCDSLFVNRNNYIGFPLSKLINAIGLPVGFSMPEGMGKRRKGIAHYKNILVYLPELDSGGFYRYEIVLATKVAVNISEYVKQSSSGEWDSRMRLLLGYSTIIAIKSFD
jgi:hypothetical protein